MAQCNQDPRTCDKNGTPCVGATRSCELDGNDVEPIAIIGFAFKFPQQGDTQEGFWKMLLEKQCAMAEFPRNRMSVNGHYRKEKRQTTLQLRGGHFIEEDLAAFDADFFSISPTEASALDPMQRWLLEISYHAFENAGIPLEELVDSATSVHTGSFAHDYMIQTSRDVEQFPTYAGYGLGAAMLANRISWFYNLTGPSIAVDSACSSSAMALDMACQSLKTGSSTMGLVAGCNLTFAPETFAWLSNMNMLSPDSKSYSFDHRANGYARGEGIAVMIVKRLDDAIRDGNTIRAVIRSTGANEDGRTAGITQPSQSAQERLIKDTYARAGLSLAHTRYVEAHGTGTPLGDPLEAAAIGRCFRSCRSEDQPLYIGSVKSNIGHLEGASGLAGVIKVVLALEAGLIPPNANFEKLNPAIDASYLRVRIPEQPKPWPTPGLRRASVNSFGYGGANCHIVLDDAHNYLQLRGMRGKHKTLAVPPEPAEQEESSLSPGDFVNSDVPARVDAKPRLLVLSARDELGIDRLATSYEEHFVKLSPQKNRSDDLLDHVAYTLDSHRTAHTYRSSVVVYSLEDLLDIRGTLTKGSVTQINSPQLGFVFTGQGAQWFAMGRELLDYPVYRASLEDASAHLTTLGCSWSAIDELDKDQDQSNVDMYSQALCTIVQVALVDLLSQANINPSAVVGHSSGEIAAAYAAGYISKQDAWKIAYFRGVVALELSKSKADGRGAMLSVGLSENEIRPHIAHVLIDNKGSIGLTVACINSPRSVTIAGDESLIRILKGRLERQEVFVRELRVPVAYHSAQMQAVANQYLQSIGAVSSCDPQREKVPMFSSVSGTLVDTEQLCRSEYWMKNMVSPVLFSCAVSQMCNLGASSLEERTDRSVPRARGVNRLLEIGPHSSLQGPLRDILNNSGKAREVPYSSVLLRGQSATRTLMNVAGTLWCSGYPVHIRAVNELYDASECRAKPEMLVDLPAYPFNHSESFWFESRMSKSYRFRDHIPNDLLGSRCSDWSPLDARWRLLIRERELPWIEDHLVNGRKVYPGTGMLTMAIEGAKQLADPERVVSGFALREVVFESAMNIRTASESLEVLTSLRPSESSTGFSKVYTFSISSYNEPDWVQNCRGSIGIEYQDQHNAWTMGKRHDGLEELTKSYHQKVRECSHAVDVEAMYGKLESCGLKYGPAFQIAKSQKVSSDSEAVAEVFTFKGDEEEPQAHVIHPVTFDAIGHLCFTAFTAGGKKDMATSMPQKLEYAWISSYGLAAREVPSVQACSSIVEETPRGFEADCVVMDTGNSKEVRLCIRGLKLAFVSEIPRKTVLPNPRQRWYSIEQNVDLSMLSWDELGQCLREMCTSSSTPFQMASNYIGLAAHQSPGMRICQVASGSGEQTRQIIDHALDTHRLRELMCERYTLADSAHTNVELARNAFSGHGRKMEFHVFDPVCGSACEYFEAHDHDILIVLDHDWTHGVLRQALGNLRKMLKPGGKLIIQEPTADEQRLSSWNDDLNRAGFSGPNLRFACDDVSKGIMVSTAMEGTSVHRHISRQGRVIIAGNFGCERHVSLMARLTELLEREVASSVIEMSVAEVARRPDTKGCLLVMLSDPEHLCLGSLSEESLYQLQHIIPNASDVLWISDVAAESRIDGSPVSAIIEGAARSLRFEHNDTRIVTLALSSFDGDRTEKHVLQVVRKMLATPAGSNYEQEYREVAGFLNTERIIESAPLKQMTNAKLMSRSTTTRLQNENFKLGIEHIGNPETLRYVRETDLSSEICPDDVEIQVRAIAIESRDYRRAMGKTKKVQFGNACAGTIIEAGSDSGCQVGDRVFHIGKGTFKSRVRTRSERVVKIPHTVDSTECCASIPALTAAYYALAHIGRWQKGETVLVYPCDGFIGEAAIKVCRKLGAPVWATKRRDGDSLLEHAGLPESSKLSHDETSQGHVWRDPMFHGADIILCTEPVENHQSWDLVNKFGRVVYMPCITGAPILAPSFQHVPPNITFSAVNFQEIAETRPLLLKDAFENALDILEASTYPCARESFPASRVVEAFKQVANSNGQTVITLEQDEEITVTSEPQSTTKLDPRVTYVVCGGTGGVGRGIARWCASRGARNLILLSRSGATGKEAQGLLEWLKGQGVRVEAPPCDVADQQALRKVLDHCALVMPPVKGCIQASGAFKDLSFEKMSLDDWNVAIKSKVTASWNLHKTLPAQLDFFIMTSSMSGILGMISQSSYAGANVYQDALARHRIALGEKAAALDLGVLQDVGFLSDAQKERLDRMGYFEFNYEAEIHALLDIYCDPANNVQAGITYRPVTGFKTTAQMVADGVEVPFTFEQPLWQHTQYAHVEQLKKSRAVSAEPHVKASIEAADNVVEATALATDALRKRVATLLSTAQERLLENSAMQTYGIDSLVAIELRNWLRKTFGVDIAVFEIVGGASFSAVGTTIATHIREAVSSK